jgi:hypothetical protein
VEPDRFVRPGRSGGWDVIVDKDKRASHHETGAQARAWARTTVRQEKGVGNGKIRIESRDGKTRDESV